MPFFYFIHSGFSTFISDKFLLKCQEDELDKHDFIGIIQKLKPDWPFAIIRLAREV